MLCLRVRTENPIRVDDVTESPLFCFALAVLASPFKSKLRLEAENAVLRHKLNILRRRLPGRARLTNLDRWFFIQLYRWFQPMGVVAKPLEPATEMMRADAGLHTDQARRQVGEPRFDWPRDHFCRSTMAPWGS